MLACNLISFIILLVMISQLISHIMLAIAVWIIATIIIKKKAANVQQLPKKFEIYHQFHISCNQQLQEPKKKKNKKSKKKSKKGQQGQGGNNNQNRYSTVQKKQDTDQDRIEEQSQHSAHENVQTKSLQILIRNQSHQILTEKDYKIKGQHYFKQPYSHYQSTNLNSELTEKIDFQYKQQDRKKIVNEQIQLMRNYFMDELEQVIPYNGKYGFYKLSLEGSSKAIYLEWVYTSSYPKEIIQVLMNKDELNPLQVQKIQSILKQQKQIARKETSYKYLFNLATSIYQDLMIAINCMPDEDKSQKQQVLPKLTHFGSITEINNNQFDLTKPHNDPKDLRTKKQIYGKILDQIFYLHDMIQKPDVSTMMKNQSEEIVKIKQQQSPRGRYWAEFQQLQHIGEGGFGKVYRVRHKLDGNIYAIKKAIVNYSDLNDRKILKEVALLSKLNHPNIVRYYQSWLQDATCIDQIVEDMDYTNGQVSKVQQLKKIYKRWKHDRSDGIAFQSGSQNSYQGQAVQNSGIVFQDDEDSGIVFQNGAEEINLSNNSRIEEDSNAHHSAQSSTIMRNLDFFPFKILYIAMQFCNGINLREFINHRFDEEEQKIQILRGILQGLAYIHQKKIIHRDLKPANIFLTEHNKVKIGDFGLATSQERSISISLQSNDFDPLQDKTRAVGTGFYRSPQQLKSNKYDQKVDIYSLGIIMLQLFYPFRTLMQRADVLKQVTQKHTLPKEFIAEREGTDILQSIVNSLRENPEERPSAGKLLQNFRNKYFTQLVSCIANPKHFQFSQLLNHLFDIKNEAVTPLMFRDYFKNYFTTKIQKIYHIHRAVLFPTLPLIPVQDFIILNGHRMKANRNNKYLLITNRGVVLQYVQNCLKAWLKYAKQDFRRKKLMSLEQQRSSIRRYTFQKVINWKKPKNNQDLCFHEKKVTAFDLAYKLDQGFNAFYLCQILKISEAIILTLNLTQKTPPVYLFHSQIFTLLAEKYKVPKDFIYGTLLSINQEQFNSLTINKRIDYLQSKNIPSNFAKRLCQIMQDQFDNPVQMLEELQINKQSQIYKIIQQQIFELTKVRERVKGENKLKWKMMIPQSNCNGFFWEIGLIKGLTSVQQYANGVQFCNYHIEMSLDPDKQIVDVSIWCIGEYLEQQMQKIIVECWKHGLTTRWYDWQIGEREDSNSRHSIILKKRNDRVQMMVRHNQGKKGEHRQDRESSFISLDQFNWDVFKQDFTSVNAQSYH